MQSNEKQEKIMSDTLLAHIKRSVAQSKLYNSNQVVAPKVILWPDSESQWLSIVDTLRKEIPAFLTLGTFQPEDKQGPAIWLKCMVNRSMPEVDWDEAEIPIIYLPGVSKADFKEIEEASVTLQPLMEYQFTGSLWTQENGKEWTVLAFLQNDDFGMGLDVVRDNATKESLINSLPELIKKNKESIKPMGGRINSTILTKQFLTGIVPKLINWIEYGEVVFKDDSVDYQKKYKHFIEQEYQKKMDYSLVLDFVRVLGKQEKPWEDVWAFFANAPHKYPKLVEYLGQISMDEVKDSPESSWPTINKKQEELLCKSLLGLKVKSAEEALHVLELLSKEHKKRIRWVWAEIGQSPFALSLPYLLEMAQLCGKKYNIDSIDTLATYYKEEGYQIDLALKELSQISVSKEYKAVIEVMVDLFYKPWLEKLTKYFQVLVKKNVASIYDTKSPSIIEKADFVLFVDAFRYDIAIEFCQQLSNKFEATLQQSWSALPSLTPTSKPSVSPIVSRISKTSNIKNFQPQFLTTKACTPYYFKKELAEKGIVFLTSPSKIEDPKKKYWMEIGDIDTKGHQEQAEMLRRVPQLLNDLKDTINRIAAKGVNKITIVTDHGWLLLPGGLPKASLHKDFVETRWGRCAELKEGAQTDYLQLPWTWNKDQYIAYAPGISFFKKNEEYAHGGISIHECMTPLIQITLKESAKEAKSFIEEFKWIGLRLQVQTSGVNEDYSLDVRTKKEDKSSSVLLKKALLKEDNLWNVLVDDYAEGQTAALILINPNGVIIDSKLIEIGR